MLHTFKVVLALGPIAISILRDRHRWLWWGDPIARSGDFHEKRAKKLVRRIVRLGPTFVKLAQVFAARADLIPEPYLSELGTLVDSVPAVPWPEIEREITASYGQTPASLFESIDTTPVAAASLGQVHRGRWRGRDVAIKVLRPGVRKLVERDVDAARRITIWVAQKWPIPHALGAEALVAEFEQRVGEEMDFRCEAAYATEVRNNFAGNNQVVIPEIIDELTRERVMVMEYVEGTRVDRLPQGSVNADRLAGLIIGIYVQMMLVDALFHADPHPGNLMLTSDGRLVLVDFGMMVRVPPELRLSLIKTVFAAIRRDPKGVAEGFHALGIVAPGASIDQIDRLSELLVSMASSRLTTQERMELMITERIMQSLYDFPVILPRELVYFARTATLIEGIGTRYNPYFNAIETGTPIVLRLRSRILRSLGKDAEPNLEEIASIAGWAIGRGWRRFKELLDGRVQSRIPRESAAQRE